MLLRITIMRLDFIEIYNGRKLLKHCSTYIYIYEYTSAGSINYVTRSTTHNISGPKSNR